MRIDVNNVGDEPVAPMTRPMDRRANPRPEFVIFTPSYSEEYGGIIALHALCARLRDLGYFAALWPWDKPASIPSLFRRRAAGLKYLLKRKWRFFNTGPFASPIAGRRDLEDAIVVYPEIVAGNPLNAQHVVRWFLHKPGFHTGVVDFGDDELSFYYDDAFNTGDINDRRRGLLRVSYMHPAYRQTNFGPRQGSCVMFRKGKDRKLDQHPADATVLDGLSHEKIAEAFNATKIFYCYDLYTYYTIFAAVCGCVPVIIPEEGLSRSAWHATPEETYGRAYGVDEIELARAQRPQLIARLAEIVDDENRTVHRFVAESRKYFHSEG